MQEKGLDLMKRLREPERQEGAARGSATNSDRGYSSPATVTGWLGVRVRIPRLRSKDAWRPQARRVA